MARRRMIDPNFWDSEDVARLSIMERLLLIGLFSNADDFGKGRGNLTTIRSKIFPNDDFSLKDIEKALKNIRKNVNVLFYEVEKNQYYKFTKWSHWQRVDKPQTSMIPEPSDSTNDSENDSYNGSDSYNESDNNSENESENDYRLKERKGKEVKGREGEIKNQYGEFGRVRLTNSDIMKLNERFGESIISEYISKVDNYVESKGKPYTNYYAAILNWLKNAGIKENEIKPEKEYEDIPAYTPQYGIDLNSEDFNP